MANFERRRAQEVEVTLERDQWSGQWVAYLAGKSSPILRPVPGNTAPAQRWTWGTPEAAEVDLRAAFYPVEVKITKAEG